MILSSPFVVIVRYWFLQGWLYMNWVERLHRVLLEILVFVPVVALLSNFLSGSTSVLISAFIAHTLSAILNGHPWAVLVHDAGVHSVCYFGDRKKFLRYVEKMQQSLLNTKPRYIRGAVIFGSIVKGVFRETSDLDIRYIAEPGLWNGLRAAHWVFVERLKATMCGFPMDAYMFLTKEETEQKMKVGSEPPVDLYTGPNNDPSLWSHSRSLSQMSESLAQNVNVEPPEKPPRVVIVSSGGGHLTEALLAIEGIPLRATIATLKLPHTKHTLEKLDANLVWLIDPHNNFGKYFKNVWQSFWLIVKTRPDFVISTGAGMAVWTCLFGKALGSKLIFIETAARVTTPSRTGKLMYRLADLFIIQWPPLKSIYPKAHIGGVLL